MPIQLKYATLHSLKICSALGVSINPYQCGYTLIDHNEVSTGFTLDERENLKPGASEI